MKRLAIACLALAVLQTGCASASPSHTGAYSREHIKKLVAKEARAMRFPVPLALAVAHTESNFDAAALSSKGARGVMQIMPATSKGEYGINPDRLWEPRINIRMGLHFLGRLVKRYGGSTNKALRHYNGGAKVGPGGRVRFRPATRAYVRKVRRLQSYYARQFWLAKR